MDSFHNGHALVVGISRYLHTTPLSFNVVTDAIDFAQVLKSTRHCGYPEQNIKLLIEADATASAFEQGMEDLARRATGDSTAVIFFSGHGKRVFNPDGTSSSYLVLHDSEVGRLNNLISGARFTELLKRIPSKRVLVALDSCYAGGAAEIKSGSAGCGDQGLDRSFCELLSGEGRAILASSCADQVSRIDPGERNSRFTKWLLEGLQGAAAKPKSGVIRVTELFHFVQTKMEGQAMLQEPLFVSNLKKDFPIALAPRLLTLDQSSEQPKEKAETATGIGPGVSTGPIQAGGTVGIFGGTINGPVTF